MIGPEVLFTLSTAENGQPRNYKFAVPLLIPPAHRTDSAGSDLPSTQCGLTECTHFYEYYHSRKGYFAAHSLIYGLIASISICCPAS